MKKSVLLFLIVFVGTIFSQTSLGKLEKVFSDGFFTEGPVSTDDGKIFFTDLTFTSETDLQAGNIWLYDANTDKTTLYRSPSGMANGLEIYKGKLYACEAADYGGRRITETDIATGRAKIYAAYYNEKHFNSPNDLIFDSKGNLYFTDPRYSGHEPIEQPVNGVYKVTPDKKIELLTGMISMPNGIGLSPDEKILYVVCNDETDPATNTSENLKGNFIAKFLLHENQPIEYLGLLVSFKYPTGPDGILVDREGNIWAAIREEAAPYIGKYDSEGKELMRIPLPEVPSNLCFGKGKFSNYLFITAGGSLYKYNLN
ncbi:MAG: SMP-30/gluconolactonase/LRE family protein [Melioribacteraceae bacterium]